MSSSHYQSQNDREIYDTIDEMLSAPLEKPDKPHCWDGKKKGKSKYRGKGMTREKFEKSLRPFWQGINLHVEDILFRGNELPHEMVEYKQFVMLCGGEARGEPKEGLLEVAEVILRRARQRGYFGKNINQVMWKGAEKLITAQFSCMYSKSPTHLWYLNEPTTEWIRVAALVLPYYFHPDKVNYNDVFHYHSVAITPPSWTDKLNYVYSIGNHLFYEGY